MGVAEKLITVAENIPKVFQAGEATERKRILGILQQNGERTDYSYTFCNTALTHLNMPYEINAENVMYMFMNCTEFIDGSDTTINITSERPTMMYVFSNCNKMTAPPVFNFLNAPIVKTYTSMYSACYKVDNINVYWGDGACDPVTQRNACQNMFYKCWSLKNIDFGGEETGSPLNLDLSYAKELTVDSVNSLLSSLMSIPPESSGKYEITLATETYEALTQEILDGFTAKGWTIVSKTQTNVLEE